jgi:hypothetical protein
MFWWAGNYRTAARSILALTVNTTWLKDAGYSTYKYPIHVYYGYVQEAFPSMNNYLRPMQNIDSSTLTFRKETAGIHYRYDGSRTVSHPTRFTQREIRSRRPAHWKWNSPCVSAGDGCGSLTLEHGEKPEAAKSLTYLDKHAVRLDTEPYAN